MFPVAVICAVGWLFLFIVLLAVPPSSRPRPGVAADPPVPAEAPPAVVSALAGQLDRHGFGATPADLVARGWFGVRPPTGPSGPAMCLVAPEPPAEPLAPYERRVVAHRQHALVFAGLAYAVLAVTTIGVGASRRPSAAGRAVLNRWRTAAMAPGDAQVAAYAAALGVAPAAAEMFASAGKNTAWSSYRGSWQPIAIETNADTWPWPRAIAMLLLIISARWPSSAGWSGCSPSSTARSSGRRS